MPIKPEVSTPWPPALATPIICPACLKLTALRISNKRNCECHFITGFYSAPSLRVHESWSRHQNFALFPAWTSVHCLSSSEQFGWCTIHIKLRAVVNYNKLVVLFNHGQKSHLRTCIVSRQDPWCLLMGGRVLVPSISLHSIPPQSPSRFHRLAFPGYSVQMEDPTSSCPCLFCFT